jgi:hypothetical protein
MAVREFKDERGKSWRVWCIMPEAIHPVTRAEDYLADCYQLGWLVFETTAGDEKKRLCPFPKDWDEAEEHTLREMLGRAEVVSSRIPRHDQTQRETNDAMPTPAALADGPGTDNASNADLTDLTVIRSFRYPGGRLWTAALAPDPHNEKTLVLRFTAGARAVNLERWPRDWPDFPDEALVDLLRSARRSVGRRTADTPRRRYTDPPA